MSFDGNGNYVVPVGTAAVSGAVIDASKYNAFLTDLQTALSKAYLRDGQSAIQANVPMGGFKLTNLAAGTVAGDSARYEQIGALALAQGAAAVGASPPRATRIDIASVAGTVDLTANAPNTDDIRMTGALTITAFTVAVGRVIRVTAAAAHTLTNNASIVTQTGANIVCVAGDTYGLRATAANTVEIIFFTRAVLTLPTASETVSGIIELATNAEVITGTDTVRAVTPAGMKAGLNASGTAPIYACRAWVRFNGTGTVAINGSGNVSSITDNAAGDFTVNFTTALPDANYAVTGAGAQRTSDAFISIPVVTEDFPPTASACRFRTFTTAGALGDWPYTYFAAFR